MQITEKDVELLHQYQADWNKWIREILGIRLLRDQRNVVEAVQQSPKTSVRSGNSIGKDYVAAAISLAFLYLYSPSKVINTAPTGRQVTNIMMAEISRMYRNSKIPLGGVLLNESIRFLESEHYLLGFKAGDTAYRKTESWQGFHSPNILVVVTEASGIEQSTYESIESILTGNSRLLIVFNPNRTVGEAYKSTKSPRYKKFRFSGLNSPNVRAKKTLIPGVVDYEWVKDKVENAAWCTPATEEEAKADAYSFKWEGKWYIPGDLFLVKVMGEFPRASEGALIPLEWIELANQRWRRNKPKEFKPAKLRLGVDIAGQGRDATVFLSRYDNYVKDIIIHAKSGETEHMVNTGRIKNMVANGGFALIDTIGEGSGTYSRLKELEIENVRSAKFSNKAKDVNDYDLTDFSGERTFLNMRAYCYWAIRDNLDPAQGGSLALPPDDMLTEELTEIKYTVRSDGKIQIEKKDDIKDRLGRSPDKADGLALSYFSLPTYPEIRFI